MYKITKKKRLTKDICLLDVHAPRVAETAEPGQFVIVITGEKGERIPLTICDYDRAAGTVTIVVQEVGVSSYKICCMEEGDEFDAFVGPLGLPSEFVYENLEELRGKNILFIAGGVGAAPVYPQVKWLRENGVDSDVIIGCKGHGHIILADEMRSVAKELFIATDDGSLGYKGLVTNLFEDLVKRGKKYDLIIAIGPMVMMKFVCLATKKYGIKTIVSLNSLMVDGTGMCGACRVTVAGKTRFTCVEGPEFDGHEVDFDEAMRRQSQYRTIEQRRAKAYLEKLEGHKCKIGLND